ncbi:MAG: hypothetical protein GQ559_10125, partial [Desulfobulbaceae bacterium]|nr:hypothetical protein [Desulfobulbaceae bacterium]
MTPGTLTLILDEKLAALLPRKYRGTKELDYPLTRRASIKDIIEALHIPHTEVDSIFYKDTEISFFHIPEAGESFFLHSF